MHDQCVEFLGRERAVVRQPVAFVPDDLDAATLEEVGRREDQRLILYQHAHAPAVDVVEIPDPATHDAGLAGKHGQPLAL